MKKTVALHNLGCKVNAYELEAIQQLLENRGYEIVPFAPGADVYIINTCTVTNIADRKSRQMLHKAKKMNPDAVVVACGCYVQAAGEKLEEDTAIDLIIGNNKKKDLVDILENFLAEREDGGKPSDAECKSFLVDMTHNREYETLSISKTAERVLSELTKLLCGQNAGAVLREFSDVLAIPIPELRPMFGFAQHNPHHDRDVWQHTIAVVEHIPPEPVLRWAALLHDVGKPPCFSLADDGVGHFYGHAAKSTELADAILMRLRMDTAGRTRITQLIRYHDLPIAPEPKPIRRLMHKLGVEPVRQLFALHIADTCGQSAICAGRVQTYQEAGRVLDKLLAADACFSLRDLAVNGSDLLALGLRGRAVGAALQACLDAVMDERVANERAALLAYAAENLHRFANS